MTLVFYYVPIYLLANSRARPGRIILLLELFFCFLSLCIILPTQRLLKEKTRKHQTEALLRTSQITNILSFCLMMMTCDARDSLRLFFCLFVFFHSRTNTRAAALVTKWISNGGCRGKMEVSTF